MSLSYFELQAITNGRQSNLNKQFPFNLFSLSSRKEILIEFHFVEDMFNKEYVGVRVVWGHPSTRNERDCVLNKLQIHTEGSRLMLLLGPGKNSHKPKIALAKFLFYERSNKINSP